MRTQISSTSKNSPLLGVKASRWGRPARTLFGWRGKVEFRSLLGSDRQAWHAPAPFLHILELMLAAGTTQTFCSAHGSAGVALDYLAVAGRTADSTAVPG